MTVDEAISKALNSADCAISNGNLIDALEFLQLAKWLKDYRRLLGQEAESEEIYDKR